MKDLTFGEQVKIILSRKGMTIKELAEQIQEETGKAMSRQNLTQRLGRDNFQEQDMRMIAKILGCPFRLSIFPTSNEDDFNFDEEALLNYVKKSSKKKKEEHDEDVYQQEFVFDEMMTASVAEMPAASEFEEESTMEEVVEEYEEELTEEPAEEYEEELTEEPVEEYEEELTEEPVEEYEEELVEEPAEEYEEEYEEEFEEESVEEIIEEFEEESVEEIIEELEKESVEEVIEEQKEESEEAPVEEPEHKQEKFRGGLFFKFGRSKKNKKADKRVDKVYEEKSETEEIKLDRQEEVKHEILEVEEKEPDFKENTFEPVEEASEIEVEEPEMEEKELAEEEAEEVVAPKEEPLPSQAFIKELEEKFEPIVKPQDENEDLKIGELNPYTGHEYQTNSVRMHPKKIGYVQVYDRTKHGWVNMTEWAFLGYQEKKKKQLGRNYEPPIYLD